MLPNGGDRVTRIELLVDQMVRLNTRSLAVSRYSWRVCCPAHTLRWSRRASVMGSGCHNTSKSERPLKSFHKESDHRQGLDLLWLPASSNRHRCGGRRPGGAVTTVRHLGCWVNRFLVHGRFICAAEPAPKIQICSISKRVAAD